MDVAVENLHDLRLIEVDRDDLDALPKRSSIDCGNGRRSSLWCCAMTWSFEDISGHNGLTSSAKSLKSAMEGGVLGPPENVLMVATSNRRHLMPRGHMTKPAEG